MDKQKQGIDSLKLGVEELFRKHADENYDGHYTIMKFTTNYRVCFGTPNSREDIAFMFNAETIEGAMWKCINGELHQGEIFQKEASETERYSLDPAKSFTLDDFLSDRCVVDWKASADKQELYETYKEYVTSNKRPPEGEPYGKYKFYEALNERLNLKEIRESAHARRRYKGIALIRQNKREGVSK